MAWLKSVLSCNWKAFPALPEIGRWRHVLGSWVEVSIAQQEEFTSCALPG